MQNIEKTSTATFMCAPSVELGELNNLFFELTRLNCNLKCKNCYIKKNSHKEVKDYLKIDKIKNTLLEARKENLQSIYLTGGEPMMHPDFNAILRMCLKFSSVTILTNGTFINEKKARFLRKIDDESKYETIFRISLDHWEESKNDAIRGIGNFRKVMLCINSLIKYEFNPIISFVNYYNEDETTIFENFHEHFKKIGFEFEAINLKIIPNFSSNYLRNENENIVNDTNFDCKNSRIVSNKGVFACPILCNDFRARTGESLKDYNKKVYLDTEKCAICMGNKNKAFANNWM